MVCSLVRCLVPRPFPKFGFSAYLLFCTCELTDVSINNPGYGVLYLKFDVNISGFSSLAWCCTTYSSIKVYLSLNDVILNTCNSTAATHITVNIIAS